MYKICIFFDYKNKWALKYFDKKIFKNNQKYKFFYHSNQKYLKNFDVVFLFGLTRIIKKKIISNNKLVLVVHESNLPKGRGMNPVQNLILSNVNRIPIRLIVASNLKVDSGDIILQDNFILKGYDLINEIRKKQFKATIKIMKLFLKKFPKYELKKQKGKSTYFKRMTKSSNELNINKTIKENFNIIRISSKKYPAYFIFKKKKFYLNIYKK